MISRSGCVNWVSCLGYKVCFGLDVIRIPYVFLLVVSIAMAADIWASLTPTERSSHSLDATRRSRKAATASGALLLRLQRVDGRRFDAFVADLLCSRLHGGAAPIIGYVSAPLVRVRVFIRASVCACARRRQCVWAFPISCVWEHASSLAGQRARTVGAQRGIGSCEC